MKLKSLGGTGIEVSICCLGTMNYGEQNTQNEAHKQMDYAVESGINFFDTAELYPIPPKPDTQGLTESIIGNWFKSRSNRDKIVLASKIIGRSTMNWCRDGESETRINNAQIDYAIENSLRRLQTDYIDLYQIHWPDRPMANFGSFNYIPCESDFVSFQDILTALEKHIQKGNIRHIGLSNETPWGVMQFLKASENNSLPKIVSVQNAYNLLNRTYENGLSEISHREGVGLLAYSPLGQGSLTGKYSGGARPEGARFTLFNRGQRYETPSSDIMIKKYVALAKENCLTPAQLAIRFCSERTFMTSVIIGATKMEQLKEDIDAFNVVWSYELEDKVNDLHKICPNPCP